MDLKHLPEVTHGREELGHEAGYPGGSEEDADKDDQGVKKMLMSTVRAVNDDGSQAKKKRSGKQEDSMEALLEQEELKRKEAEEREAMTKKWKRSIPNAMYFKAAAVSDSTKCPFLNFDTVLDINAENLRGAIVKPDNVLQTSIGRIKEARSLTGGDATSLRASVLSSVNDAVSAGGGSKKMSDLEEWQIYHVEKCLEEKDRMRSLPNLNGHVGKFKLSTRANPKMLHL